MKRKSLQITALIFSVSMSLGSTGFASTSNNTLKSGQKVQCSNGENCKRHSFYESDIILKKLGLTEQDIISGRKSGKTIFDLTIAKNLTEEQVKKIIIQEITTSVNNKVSVGKISKEDGDKIIEKKTLRVQNWDGKLKTR